MISQSLPNLWDIDWPDQMKRLVWAVTTTSVKIEVIVTLREQHSTTYVHMCYLYIYMHIGCEDQKTILSVIH